ncbi:MAG: hypothetical protein ABW004_07485 [Aeromicrobium sp.]
MTTPPIGPDSVLMTAVTQVVDDPTPIEEMGPGWDYYLDRLVAAETGGDVAGIDFEADYFPAQREHHAAIVRDFGGS